MFHWKVEKLPRIVVNFGPFLCYYFINFSVRFFTKYKRVLNFII
jgi:hypothetical protein